jgi:hypothetical protein
MQGGQSDKRTPVVIRQPESRDALVDRVASSAAFQKSNRLRELLIFLCSRALAEPGAVVHEPEIGVGVFGRRPDYDTAQDTIVRVQVSQLRKKLQQYFETSGRDETTIIEIPKGGYTPVFLARAAEPEGVAVPSGRPGLNGLTALFAVLAVAGFALAGWLWFRPARAVPLAPPLAEAGPTVDRLWRQLFDNGRRTCVVLSDVNLALFEDTIQQQLSLSEYRNREYARLLQERLTSSDEKQKAALSMAWYFTHISDANLAGAFSALNAVHGVPTDVVFARDFGVSYLQSHNVILLGTRRTNPWMELFEGQLNFRSAFRENPRLAYFENLSPLPGESATYPVNWARRGYCRVVFLPNPTRSGSILLVSGTDMQATAAGGQFISSERWLQALRSRLALAGTAPFPFFEVLLRADYMAVNTPKFEVVAHRLPKL